MAKSFFQYIMSYLNKNTPRGDLARDMMYEQRMHPEEDLDQIDTEERFMHYLSAHRACQECIDVAHRCWVSYHKTLDSVC